jgi:hypothetical protein
MKFIRNTNYDVIKGKISLGVLFSLSYVISSVAKKAHIVSASWNLFRHDTLMELKKPSEPKTCQLMLCHSSCLVSSIPLLSLSAS